MARVRDLWFRAGADGREKTARHGSAGKRWLSVWQGPDGKDRTKAFAKRSDAERYAAKMDADQLAGSYIDPKAARTTVAHWCETWLSGYATRRPSTVQQAKVHVRQIVAEFGPLPLGAVRPSHVRSWTSKLREEGLAVSYVYALHSRLAQIMSDAVHDGMMPKSPCSRRTSPGSAKQRPYVATTEQVWALQDEMPERLRAAVLLGAFVGLRSAESCGLRVADIDFMRGIVFPRVQYPAQELKTKVSRTPVPIPSSLAAELSAHVAAGYSGGETFLSTKNGDQLRPQELERAMRKARAKVEDLPTGFRYHDLRHYLASLLIASGSDVKIVQERLRHASANTTLGTYAHMWPGSDESTRAAIDAVLTAQTEQRRNGRGVAR